MKIIEKFVITPISQENKEVSIKSSICNTKHQKKLLWYFIMVVIMATISQSKSWRKSLKSSLSTREKTQRIAYNSPCRLKKKIKPAR